MKKFLLALFFVLTTASRAVADGGSGMCEKCVGVMHPEIPGWVGICREVETPGARGTVGCQDGQTIEMSAEAASYSCTFSGGECSVPPSDPPPTWDNDDNCGNQCSPLVLNMENGPWRFSGADDPVLFDLDADGTLDRLTWTARGSAIAFLAIDHGLDGVIGSGAELFGNRPGYFANGFETLKVYDSNRDGLIDHNDSVWPFLRLWTDVSHDGVSQAGELQTLDAAGVQGLDLAYHETARADRNGNEFRQQARYWRGGQARPYYDVWLARVP